MVFNEFNNELENKRIKALIDDRIDLIYGLKDYERDYLKWLRFNDFILNIKSIHTIHQEGIMSQ